MFGRGAALSPARSGIAAGAFRESPSSRHFRLREEFEMWRVLHVVGLAAVARAEAPARPGPVGGASSVWAVATMQEGRYLGAVEVSETFPLTGLQSLQGTQGVCARADGRALHVWTIKDRASPRACRRAEPMERGAVASALMATNYRGWGVDATDPDSFSCQSVEGRGFVVVIAQPPAAVDQCVAAFASKGEQGPSAGREGQEG